MLLQYRGYDTNTETACIITETGWEFSCLYMSKTVKTKWINDNVRKGLCKNSRFVPSFEKQNISMV